MMEATEMGEVKDILVAIARLQVELKTVDKKIDEISRLSNMAQATEQSAKSAHNRIDDLKADMSEKFQQQKKEYEKELSELQKDLDREITAIRKEYDKEMLKQDEKWGERLKPFVDRQKKFEAAFITTGVTMGLGGIVYLIQYFS